MLRTVTNLSIAIGSGIAAIALALGTAEAYQVVIVFAGVIGAFGALPLLRLPASVDAAVREVEEMRTETGSIVVLIVAALTHTVAEVLTHTFAEVLSQAGAWGLDFELADPARAGAYQGVFGMGFSLGALASPIVVNATAITFGLLGWVMLGVIFLAAAFGIWLISRRAVAAAETR